MQRTKRRAGCGFGLVEMSKTEYVTQTACPMSLQFFEHGNSSYSRSRPLVQRRYCSRISLNIGGMNY